MQPVCRLGKTNLFAACPALRDRNTQILRRPAAQRRVFARRDVPGRKHSTNTPVVEDRNDGVVGPVRSGVDVNGGACVNANVDANVDANVPTLSRLSNFAVADQRAAPGFEGGEPCVRSNE